MNHEPTMRSAARQGRLRPSGFDELDRAQRASAIRIGRQCPELSTAGWRLLSVSRQEKASQNDADRLRKYLARFGLDWTDIARATTPGRLNPVRESAEKAYTGGIESD